jgi:hypothetical protein
MRDAPASQAYRSPGPCRPCLAVSEYFQFSSRPGPPQGSPRALSESMMSPGEGLPEVFQAGIGQRELQARHARDRSQASIRSSDRRGRRIADRRVLRGCGCNPGPARTGDSRGAGPDACRRMDLVATDRTHRSRDRVAGEYCRADRQRAILGPDHIERRSRDRANRGRTRAHARGTRENDDFPRLPRHPGQQHERRRAGHGAGRTRAQREPRGRGPARARAGAARRPRSCVADCRPAHSKHQARPW